jgi:hypothetical protein
VITLQDAPPVQLLACPCGCMSASRMPKQGVLREYYSTYYGSIEGSATFDGGDRFARHLSRCLKITPKGVLRILDFGGGVDAALSRSLAKRLLRNGGARHNSTKPAQGLSAHNRRDSGDKYNS